MAKALLHRLMTRSRADEAVFAAAQETIDKVHAYMRAHPNSELHRCGKMFGVLVIADHSSSSDTVSYLSAFSARLDGSYRQEGFVPPVYDMPTPPIGTDKAESQRLQRLLFAQYNMLNGRGESKNLLDIFADEKPVLSPDEWFSSSPLRTSAPLSTLPPGGAGECCAPKLLQYAYAHGWRPVALAEFWVGAPPKNELRREGVFYPPCSGRCVPILRWMLGGEQLFIAGIGGETVRPDGEEVGVLYEDEWLLVADKPAGLLSVPGKNGEPSLTTILSDRCGQPVVPAHRLDQPTSGLVVLAKEADVYKTLQAYFQRRDIFKRYEAVVHPADNHPLPAEGMISLPLLPNPLDRPRQMVDPVHGKPALTRFVVREQRPDGTCLVDFFPLTGRTHQLRVHAAHPDGLNAPILGDRLYGDAVALPRMDRPQDQRMRLHAAELRFVHPVTKEEMHFCIPSGF